MIETLSLKPLTVVMPAYNEEDAIADAVRDVQDHVLAVVAGSELIVVNDGSRDGTGGLLDEIAARDPRVRVLHRPNGGHGAALRSGLDMARGEYLLLIDSDRQIALDSFEEFWRQARNVDAVFGVRKQRHDPAFRLLLTRVVSLSLRVLFRVSLRDANVPFKIVRRSAWESASALIPPDTLAPSLFLAVIMSRQGYDIAERVIVHKKRETGVVSLRYGKLLRFCARALRQLIALRQSLDQGVTAELRETVGSV